MDSVLVQLAYRTRGKTIPLAQTDDPALAHLVAEEIAKKLGQVRFGDECLDRLAVEEAEHVKRIFQTLGLLEADLLEDWSDEEDAQALSGHSGGEG